MAFPFDHGQVSIALDRPSRRNRTSGKALVRQAAAGGAQIILLQELFETPYFCPEQKAEHFALARPFVGNDAIQKFSDLAAELGVVLPISFFERDNNVYYNTVAMIDADGQVLGRYRKAHIPDGPGYQEKFSRSDARRRDLNDERGASTNWRSTTGYQPRGTCGWPQGRPSLAISLVSQRRRTRQWL